MKETARACFKRNDNRRDTFNSQQAASARNKLRKPLPVDTCVFENRWSGKSEREREEQTNANVTTTINSVVIENVSVIAFNKQSGENDISNVCTDTNTNYNEIDDGESIRIVPSMDRVLVVDQVTSSEDVQVDVTEDAAVSAKDKVAILNDQVVSAEDKVLSTKNEVIYTKEEVTPAKDEIASTKDKVMHVNDEIASTEVKVTCNEHEAASIDKTNAEEVPSEEIPAEDRITSTKDKVTFLNEQVLSSEDKVIPTKNEVNVY